MTEAERLNRARHAAAALAVVAYGLSELLKPEHVSTTPPTSYLLANGGSIFLMAIATALALWRWLRLRQFREALRSAPALGLCPYCLSGFTTRRCAECGTLILGEPIVAPPPRRDLRAAAACGVIALVWYVVVVTLMVMIVVGAIRPTHALVLAGIGARLVALTLIVGPCGQWISFGFRKLIGR